MPNHLTDPPIVPELIQADATPEKLIEEVSALLASNERYQAMQSALASIAPSLSEDSGELACDAIEALINDQRLD